MVSFNKNNDGNDLRLLVNYLPLLFTSKPLEEVPTLNKIEIVLGI